MSNQSCDKNDREPLLPCPFCGTAPRFLEAKAGFYTRRVICDLCNFYFDGEDAEKSWNTRSRRPFTFGNEVIAEQVKEIERLTALVKEERATRSAEQQQTVVDKCYMAVRVLAEGSDWKRGEESLAEWVTRTIRAKSSSTGAGDETLLAGYLLQVTENTDRALAYMDRLSEEVIGWCEEIVRGELGTPSLWEQRADILRRGLAEQRRIDAEGSATSSHVGEPTK